MEKIGRLVQLINFYKTEAEKCKENRAYLAGCVMYGAMLEAILLSMCLCYPDQVRRTEIYKRKYKKRCNINKFLYISLRDLIKIATKLEWLPAKTDVRKLEEAEIGNLTEIITEIRNLIHPGKWIREKEYKKLRISRRHCEMIFDILQGVNEYLFNKLIKDIKKAISKK
jgi:hypothetical protein